jgi:hypothetical protein
MNLHANIGPIVALMPGILILLIHVFLNYDTDCHWSDWPVWNRLVAGLCWPDWHLVGDLLSFDLTTARQCLTAEPQF